MCVLPACVFVHLHVLRFVHFVVSFNIPLQQRLSPSKPFHLCSIRELFRCAFVLLCSTYSPPLLLKQHRACFTFNLTSSSVLSPLKNCFYFFYGLLTEACYVAAINSNSTEFNCLLMWMVLLCSSFILISVQDSCCH